jgi:hypothetical protein
MTQNSFETIEKEVRDLPGSYRGISEEALLTTFDDFQRIFKNLPPGKTWVELGSGHGLGPLSFAKSFPDNKAVGIEFELARFEASVKALENSTLTNAQFIHADLLTYPIPKGDFYFLYFPTGIVLDRILNYLGTQLESFYLIVIESHGDLLPRLKKEKWLRVHSEIPLSSARHYPQAVFFEKCAQKISDLHDMSFKEKFLVISDQSSEWIGESFGLEWVKENEFLLLTPPRTISEFQVKNVFDFEQIPAEFHSALLLRKLGMLTIQFITGIKHSHIRKIFISPSFKLELSSGEQVEWSEIKQIYWENTLCYDSLLDYFFYPHVV